MADVVGIRCDDGTASSASGARDRGINHIIRSAYSAELAGGACALVIKDFNLDGL